MKLNRKGILGLPMRLAVVFLIIGLSVPIIADVVDSGEKDMLTAELETEAGRIISSVSSVHYDGKGSSRTVSVLIPTGCEMHIGGDGADAYSISLYCLGRDCGKLYLERPAIKLVCEDTILVCGEYDLRVTSLGNGVAGVEFA